MSDLQTLSIKLEVDDTEATAKIASLQEQADKLLATLEKCRECTSKCGADFQIVGELKTSATDLVAIMRTQDYRASRTA